jgi:hypothetical protein
MEWHWSEGMFEDQDTGSSVDDCDKKEHDHVITFPAPNDPQVLLNQISTLTQTLAVLCNTGRANAANIVEGKIMRLIEKL